MPGEWYFGNAGDDGDKNRGWLLGHFIDPTEGVRSTTDLEVKWGVHPSGEQRPEWTADDKRTTLLLLVSGRFRLDLTVDSFTLARQGDYVMHFAASGEQALERLAGEIQPTLVAVLSDINMPGMDGLTLLDEVKKRFPDLAVMMVTAYGDDERRRRASELGASEFLTKPVDFDRLKEQLRPHGSRLEVAKALLTELA